MGANALLGSMTTLSPVFISKASKEADKDGTLDRVEEEKPEAKQGVYAYLATTSRIQSQTMVQ